MQIFWGDGCGDGELQFRVCILHASDGQLSAYLEVENYVRMLDDLNVSHVVSMQRIRDCEICHDDKHDMWAEMKRLHDMNNPGVFRCPH